MITPKAKLLIFCILIISIAACEKDKTSPQQYGNTMVQSLKAAKSVESKVNVEEVRKSIQAFNAANGRYPADLNELSTFNGITLKSDNYDYDPTTGNLSEKQ